MPAQALYCRRGNHIKFIIDSIEVHTCVQLHVNVQNMLLMSYSLMFSSAGPGYTSYAGVPLRQYRACVGISLNSKEFLNLLVILVCIPSFTSIGGPVSVSYTPIYIPITMYGLRLFIVVLQELQCFLHVDIIRVIISPSFVCLHLLVSEIAKCIA